MGGHPKAITLRFAIHCIMVAHNQNREAPKFIITMRYGVRFLAYTYG